MKRICILSLFCFLITCLSQAQSTNILVVPWFLDGKGHRVRLIASNYGQHPYQGTLEFFDKNGNPLAVPIWGKDRTSVGMDTPVGGTRPVTTEGGDNWSLPLQMGYAVLTVSSNFAAVDVAVIHLDKFS